MFAIVGLRVEEEAGECSLLLQKALRAKDLGVFPIIGVHMQSVDVDHDLGV
jgi:hypothetical protein